MKILVSACILGENCKYNGGNNLNQDVVAFCKGHKVTTICPELLAGLPTPRACAEQVNNRILDINGNDVTQEYETGVAKALEAINGKEFDLVILQSRSPTCGCKQIYDGSFTGKLIDGTGRFAQALLRLGYHVIDASDIDISSAKTTPADSKT